jgi:hypothetical protein
MANRKISDLTALTAPATGDLLPIVDISEAAAADKNKKITFGELLSSAPAGSAAAPSFSFDGDPNSGLYSAGADQVAISTNGTGRLFVDASGNVGINSGAPTYKLQVVAQAGAQNIFLAGQVGVSNGYQIDSTGSAITHIWSTAGGEKVRLTDGGNVGIGTSSPQEKLHIGGSGTQTLRISNATVGSAASPELTTIDFDGYLANPRVRIEAQDQASNFNGGFFALSTANTSNTLTKALTIDNQQRVGIGTSSPAYPLDVNGSVRLTNSAFLNFNNSSGTAQTVLGLFSDNSTYLDAATGGNIIFRPNASAERARLTSDGKFLVGTSSDSGGAVFQVNGDRIRVGTAKTPASASATGTAGEIAWDANYIYVCTATNTWKRSAIATW